MASNAKPTDRRKTRQTLALLRPIGRRAGPRTLEQSIETLLAIARPAEFPDSVFESLEQALAHSVRRAIEEGSLPPRSRAALARLPAKIVGALRADYDDHALRQRLAALYRESFEQAEVDGLIKFLRSRAGQAYLAKMPAVLRASMELARAHAGQLLPKAMDALDAALQAAVRGAPPHATPQRRPRGAAGHRSDKSGLRVYLSDN